MLRQRDLEARERELARAPRVEQRRQARLVPEQPHHGVVHIVVKPAHVPSDALRLEDAQQLRTGKRCD